MNMVDRFDISLYQRTQDATERIANHDRPRPRYQRPAISPESFHRHHHRDAHAAALPKVAILLCTYQGENFLADQLDSFSAQTHSNLEIFASDDGSKDGTRSILDTYGVGWMRDCLSSHLGPAEGFVANFLSLTCKASIQADYYAYSDQDDIWEPDKLQRAINFLKTMPAHIPALYCSRTRLVDANNNNIGLSPLFTKPPSFVNALVQNIGGGNTMVFNKAACALLREAGDGVKVVAHDWWAYMLIVGCGGNVFYDPYPTVRYRQHGGNLVGMNSNWSARLVRIRLLFQGYFRKCNDQNIQALAQIRNKLTPENREAFDCFSKARNRSLLPRLVGLRRSGIYRQSMLGNLGLVAAAFLNRI